MSKIFNNFIRDHNKNSYSKKRNNFYDQEKYADVTKILAFADPVCDRLIREGYENFILNDFIPKTVTDCNIRFSKDLSSELQPLLNEILDYLKLPKLIKLKVNNKVNTNAEFNAGSYRPQWGNRTIDINLFDGCTYKNVLAIMCHECTHYFMEYNKLNIDDTELNESRTDVIACLIGFSNILADGYDEIVTRRNVGNKIQEQITRIGYIADEECAAIIELIYDKRDSIIKRNEVVNLIKLAEDFMYQLDIIEPIKHKDDYTIDSNNELIELQENILNYQNLNSTAIINRCKNIIKSDIFSKEEIDKSYVDISNLCSKLQKLITTFSRIMQ